MPNLVRGDIFAVGNTEGEIDEILDLSDGFYYIYHFIGSNGHLMRSADKADEFWIKVEKYPIGSFWLGHGSESWNKDVMFLVTKEGFMTRLDKNMAYCSFEYAEETYGPLTRKYPSHG